eukprot:scaffold22638_cov138-Cylindrotheca_fusiformis.AAC.8
MNTGASLSVPDKFYVVASRDSTKGACKIAPKESSVDRIRMAWNRCTAKQGVATLCNPSHQQRYYFPMESITKA